MYYTYSVFVTSVTGVQARIKEWEPRAVYVHCTAHRLNLVVKDCLDGIPEDRLCPDGLVFDPFSRKREPCDHYFNVDCGDRLELRKLPSTISCMFTISSSEPPKGPSDLCPRLNGFYSHPDPGVCHIFYACVNGDAEEYTCSSGLWFDEYSGVCNWPEVTDRKECKADAYGKNGVQPAHLVHFLTSVL